MPHDGPTPSIAVFFSHGTSLAAWRKSGIFSREVGYYRELSADVGAITYVTYDVPAPELAVDLAQAAPATVLFNRWSIPYQLYGLIAPFVYRRRLRACSILKTNQLSGAWTAVISKWLVRRPLVVRSGYVASRSHGTGGPRSWRMRTIAALERLAVRAADLVFVATESDERYLAETYGVPADKLRRVPTPIDTERFRPDPTGVRDRDLLVYVGRLSPEKNVDLLIDAVALSSTVKLKIAGTGSLEETYRSRAGERVEFLGAVPNDQLPALLARASIFALVSDFEGSPKALLEAMACGLAVIGTRARGIADVIEDGVTGLLCDRSAESIASAIGRLQAEPALAARLGEAARDFVLSRYSQRDVARLEARYLAALRQ